MFTLENSREDSVLSKSWKDLNKCIQLANHMISLGGKKITKLLGSGINSSFWKENEAILWIQITDYLF